MFCLFPVYSLCLNSLPIVGLCVCIADCSDFLLTVNSRCIARSLKRCSFSRKVVHNTLNTCRQMCFHIECRLVSIVAGRPEFQFQVRGMFTKKEIWFFWVESQDVISACFFVMFFSKMPSVERLLENVVMVHNS